MYRILCFLLLIYFKPLTGHTQGAESIDEAYNRGLLLEDKNEFFNAIAEFRKVIKQDPNHKDALYQLSILNYQLNDIASAVRFSRRGLSLNDSRSLAFLKNQLHQKLSFADTMQNISDQANLDFKKINELDPPSFAQLCVTINTATTDKKEKLQLLLLWIYNNMQADSSRFFLGGNPISTEMSFKTRKGLCDEFSMMLEAFCSDANIPCIRIPGYVKYTGYKANDVFKESNHVWDAVYLNSHWLLCDFFWSTTVLVSNKFFASHFERRLNTDYFLSLPISFITDHNPADPVFQFERFPIQMQAFMKVVSGYDTAFTRLGFLNFEDSIKVLMKLNNAAQKIKIAEHSFSYNKHNPNDLITIYFNTAVDIYNNKTARVFDLNLARIYFKRASALIELSDNVDIKQLKSSCDAGIKNIDRRLVNRH